MSLFGSGELCKEKTGDEKSRDTVPLRQCDKIDILQLQRPFLNLFMILTVTVDCAC
jgi:hypothetical protein